MIERDVIIVGGGFAGATAARELGRAGYRCVLLEARDRLGGRAWSTELKGHPVELGGTWIHWLQPHVWAETTRYGLELVESPGVAMPGSCAWRSGGKLRTGSLDDLYAMIGDGIAKFCHDARERIPRPFEPLFHDSVAEIDSLSVRDRLDAIELSDEQREIVAGFWSSACLGACSDAGLVSMLRWFALGQWDFELMMDAVAHYKFRDGTKSLIEAMIEDGGPEIRLSCQVTRVTQEDTQVIVDTVAGERIAAAAAVVAVPMNVLAEIAFEPALGAGKLTVSRERHAGAGLKVLALVRGVPDDFFGVGGEGEPITFLSSEKEVADGVVLMIGFGPDAARLDVNDAVAVQAAIQRYLPSAEVVAVRGHNWTEDPFSRGVHSVFRPGQTTSYLHALQHPEGRCVFAGSDLANGWNGFIDGAVETGLRAAREVTRLMRA